MKPAPFEFQTASSVAEALTMFDQADGMAKYIAGGQTLGPMINLRLSQPDRLIDLSRIPELAEVVELPGGVRIGAGIRHADIEDGHVPDPSLGLLRRAARTLAYRAVRNRGTVGGSLVHADPIAEWPVVMTALGARLHLQGRSATRQVGVADFLLGTLTTCMADDEVLTAISLPRLPTQSRIGYQKFCRKAGEFAHSLAVVVLTGEAGSNAVVLGSTVARPLLLPEVTALAVATPAWRDGMAAAVRAAFIRDTEAACLVYDEYDAHLHATIVLRAVKEALGG